MKFRVGQKVELIDNNGMAAPFPPLGAVAVVERIGLTYIFVVWKGNVNNQMNGHYSPKQFRPLFTKGQQLVFSFALE